MSTSDRVWLILTWDDRMLVVGLLTFFFTLYLIKSLSQVWHTALHWFLFCRLHSSFLYGLILFMSAINVLFSSLPDWFMSCVLSSCLFFAGMRSSCSRKKRPISSSAGDCTMKSRKRKIAWPAMPPVRDKSWTLYAVSWRTLTAWHCLPWGSSLRKPERSKIEGIM